MRARTAVVIGEGVVAGLAGYVTIAVILGLADLFTGRGVLFTPAMLGSALLERTGDVCDVPVTAALVLAYTGVHLMVLTLFGVAASALIRGSERRPALWFGAFLLFVGMAWHLTAAVLTLLAPVRGCFSLFWIITASFGAALVMGGYLWRAHARLREQLRSDRYA